MRQGRPGCFGRKGKAADRDEPRSWNTDKMGRCWMQMRDGDRPCSEWRRLASRATTGMESGKLLSVDDGGRAVTMSARVRRASLKGIAEVGRRWKRESVNGGRVLSQSGRSKKDTPVYSFIWHRRSIYFPQAHPGNPRILLPQPPLPHLSFWELSIPLSADAYLITTLFRISRSLFNKIYK